MANTWSAAFVYENRADAGTVTASSSAVLTPTTYLRDVHVARKWRSENPNDQFLTFDFGASVLIDSFALMGLNLTADGATRLRLSSSDTSAQDGSLFDSGLASGRVDPRYGYLVFLLENPVSSRYCRVDLSQGSLDYVEAGRALAGLRTQVGINFLPGASRQRVSNTRKVKSRGGQTYVDRGFKARLWAVEFGFLSEDEANGFAENMEIANGDDTDILLVRDPSSDNLGRDCIWGLLTEMSAIAEPTSSPDIWSKRYSIEERL